MKIIDDDRVKMFNTLINKKHGRSKCFKLLTSENSSKLIEYIYKDCEWTELMEDKVFKIQSDEGTLVIKKYLVECGDPFVDNACEIIANVLMTINSPGLTVKLRNLAMFNDRLYLIFDYESEGTLQGFLNAHSKHLNPRILLDILEDMLHKLHMLHQQYELQHFDCRTDNIFVQTESDWVDTDSEENEDDVIVGDPGLTDTQIHLKLGDLGLCEMTLNRKRYFNNQIPRDKQYEITWGLFPRNQSVSYDFLYTLISYCDDLKDVNMLHLMDPLWSRIEEAYPEFNRNTFFNEEGRMYKYIPLSHVELQNMITDIRKTYSWYLYP